MLHLVAAETWIPKLLIALRKERKKRSAALVQISDTFGDPYRLARYYVRPLCQHNNPTTEDRDIDSVVRSDAFATLKDFLARCETTVNSDGRRQMFVLADAGMGKSSLLVMLRLMHLFSFWPKKYKCALFKLGSSTLDDITKLEDHAHTVLLLDSLDEDPTSLGRIRDRISEILVRTDRFYAVIITCRTQYFPVAEPDPMERLGSVRVSGYRCPIIYLSPFSDKQVDEYLRKRFPRSFWRWLRRRDSPLHIAALRILKKTITLHLRPMLLAYIDDLVGKDSEKELSAYEAFDILIQEWLEREVRRGKVQSRETLYAACAAVAKRLDKLGKRALSREELTEVYLEEPCAQDLELIDVGGRALLNMTSAGAFRFAHFALQEFVLAREIAKTYPRSKITIAKTIDGIDISTEVATIHVKRLPPEGDKKQAEIIMSYASDTTPTRPKDNINRISVHGTTELINFMLEARRIDVYSTLDLVHTQAVNLMPLADSALVSIMPRLARSLSLIENVEFRNDNFVMMAINCFHFRNCTFLGSSFSGTDLCNSSFTDCDMRATDFSRSRLIFSKLSGVDLAGASFASANLCAADLSESKLNTGTRTEDLTHFEGSLYDALTTWPAGFDCEVIGATCVGVTASLEVQEKARNQHPFKKERHFRTW